MVHTTLGYSVDLKGIAKFSKNLNSTSREKGKEAMEALLAVDKAR